MRYFLKLAYRGTEYHGWQIQPNATTVQELINTALSTLLGESINVVGAGRTDTGVHAKEMYAHFDTAQAIEPSQLAYKLNRLLPSDISIYQIIKVADDAHARFDAVSRSYEYHITFAKNPFASDLALVHRHPLNLALMQEAADALLEYTDFSAFSRSKTQTKTNLCTITAAHWEQTNEGLVFHISANRFLRNMVRAIVGTLLLVGAEKMSVEEFREVIESKDRRSAGESAKAKGLFLTRVVYPKQILDV